VARTPVKLMLDRERTLRFNLNAICTFEEMTGGSVTDALRNLNMTNLRKLFWVGLLKDDPTLTEEQVGDLIEFADIKTLVRVELAKALGAQVATDDDDRPIVAAVQEATLPQPDAVQIGIASMPSADTISG
jgi:hypothetical protein